MRLEARKLLEDVRRAGELIAGFVAAKGLADYAADPLSPAVPSCHSEGERVRPSGLDDRGNPVVLVFRGDGED